MHVGGQVLDWSDVDGVETQGGPREWLASPPTVLPRFRGSLPASPLVSVSARPLTQTHELPLWVLPCVLSLTMNVVPVVLFCLQPLHP